MWAVIKYRICIVYNFIAVQLFSMYFGKMLGSVYQMIYTHHMYMCTCIKIFQLLSHVKLSATWWTVAHQASHSFTIFQSLLKLFLRSKHLSWLQSPSTLILEHKKINLSLFPLFTYLPCSIGPNAMIFIFWMLSFKPIFSLSSFTFFKRLFGSSSLSLTRVVSSA